MGANGGEVQGGGDGDRVGRVGVLWVPTVGRGRVAFRG